MKRLKVAYILTILFALYAPMALIMLLSFNQSSYSSQWTGFTLTWYQALMHNQALWNAAYRSVILASSTAFLSCALGTTGAVLLFRYRFFSKKVMMSVLLLLIVVPDILFGIALLLVFNAFNIGLGFWSLLLSHVAFSFPFVLLIIHSRLEGFDRRIIEAAQDLGADDWSILVKVLIPLLWPAIISGALLAIALSLDDVIISYFVSGPDFEILPLRIYSMVRMGIRPEVNAMFTLLFLLTLFIALLTYRLNRRQPLKVS